MPYVEILGPRANESRKREVAGVITRGIVDSFGVVPSTVTIYFQPIEAENYAHEGSLGHQGAGARIFVKVHAYRRTPAERRAVANAVTPAIAACFDTPGHNVAVYFLDRERDEVAHDGHLASDELPSTTDNLASP